MSVYIYELELLSPAIVSAKRVRMNYVSYKSYIPGLSVRGAFLTSLIDEGEIDRVREEERKPSLRFSPAYPLIDRDCKQEGRHTACGKGFPSHFYMLKRKNDKNLYEPSKWVEEIRDGLESIVDLLKPIKEYLRNGYNISSIGTPVVYYDSDEKELRYARVQLGYKMSASVGINKFLRRSEYQLLFNNVAIGEGTRFWGIVIDPKDKFLSSGMVREIWVGRATTRGFGHALFKVVKKTGFKEFVTKLSSVDTNVLYAFSPVSFLGSVRSSGTGKVVFDLIPPRDKVNTKMLNGKDVVLGDRSIFISWFRRLSGQRGLRPVFETLSPGTLIFVEEKPSVEFYLWLYDKEPGGVLGLNFLFPYTPDLIRGGVW